MKFIVRPVKYGLGLCYCSNDCGTNCDHCGGYCNSYGGCPTQCSSNCSYI